MTKAEKPKKRNKFYRVLVDDNFHYMDESERYSSGDYDTAEEAVAKCKEIVDGFIDDAAKKAKSAADLYDSYQLFGEDPYVEGPTEVDFSAWDYAKERSEQIFKSKPSGKDSDA